MKNLIMVLLMAGLLLSTNSCGVLKNKRLEKNKSREVIKNDIEVSTLKIDSSKAGVNVGKTSDSKFYSEEINIKRSDPITNIELTANFKVDTTATLSGDTALKLVDVNNGGISLAIFQNKKTKELMAKVTTSAGSKITPFSEINIKRKYGEQSERLDSMNFFENHSELKKDSLDKTETNRQEKYITDIKQRQTTSNWKIWLGAAIIVGFFIWLGFRKRS